ncbi:MAG TPA: YegS/Rv2252/BmrU family lipid kinase [Acidimicrobiia bacterium]
MARWLAVVNRAAGSSPTHLDDVVAALTAAGVDFRLESPRSPEEVRELLVAAAEEGVSHFAMAGGDGTVNLAANILLGIAGMPPPVIGVLPVGTGCDLLRTFGISQELGRAAEHLATEDVYDIDVALLEGAWGSRHFVNVAQVGVGAAAAQTAPRLPRRIGSIRYPLAFAARLPRFPAANVRIVTERRTYESEALAVILANAQFFAGGWNVAPRATLIDGVLDVQVINCAKTRAPALVPKIIRGTHLSDPAVRRFSAASFEIDTDIPWPLEADGDYIGNTPVKGRVVPAALRLKI